MISESNANPSRQHLFHANKDKRHGEVGFGRLEILQLLPGGCQGVADPQQSDKSRTVQ